MSNKIIISGLLAIMIVLTGLFYSSGSEFFKPKGPVSQNVPDASYISSMTGQISEIKNDAILVSGTVGNEAKVIEFVITPKTIFTKDTIVISADQAASGKSFAPRTEVTSGNRVELIKDMTVRIKTPDNLLETDKAEAFEINYITYDLPF